MVAVRCRASKRQQPRFAAPPWNEDHPRWQELDQQLPVEHIARNVVAAMESFDWSALYECYSASGSPATHPLLMLRIVLIELRRGRFRPQQWNCDTRENDALRWAGFGICPSRSAWYAFHDRVAPLLKAWNDRMVAIAVAAEVTPGKRIALDGSTVEANASRHRLVNEECLSQRQEQLAAACMSDAQQEPITDPPVWMAKTPTTREDQRLRYDRARQHLSELHTVNNRQALGRRREAKKIVISTSDPDAALGRDKFHVFRPLYNLQLARDVDSTLILAHEVFAQPNDSGTLKPILQRLQAIPGLNVRELLVDAGYVTAHHLALCAEAGVTLYGPWQTNDYSSVMQQKNAGQKLIGKDQFRWHADEQVYVCPQGHRLQWVSRKRRWQADGEFNEVHSYRCAAEHCTGCPLRDRCTTNPKRGRSILRSEHEELIESHHARMASDEAKTIYKLRKQTVELGFADIKQHRGLRGFPRRGLQRARTHAGLLVLVHNLLTYHASVAAAPTEKAAA